MSYTPYSCVKRKVNRLDLRSRRGDSAFVSCGAGRILDFADLRSRRQNLVSSRAFTLVEVMVALSLFVVGMLSILQIFPLNRRYLAQSANTTQAVFLAQEELEQVRSQPYSNLTVGTYEAEHPVSTLTNDPLSQYHRKTLITLINGSHQTSSTDLGLKQVDTTVYWTERTLARQYTLSTYVYSP